MDMADMITTVNPIPVLSLDILPASCAATKKTNPRNNTETNIRDGCFRLGVCVRARLGGGLRWVVELYL